MPAAIPIAATVGATLVGSLLQNSQNKANQQNATAATDSARANDSQSLMAALQQLQSYQKSNPAPSASYGPVQGPTSVYGQQGGGNGQPQGNVMQSPTQGIPGQSQSNMLQALMGQMSAPPQQVRYPMPTSQRFAGPNI